LEVPQSRRNSSKMSEERSFPEESKDRQEGKRKGKKRKDGVIKDCIAEK